MVRITFRYEDGDEISVDLEKPVDDQWWASAHSQPAARFNDKGDRVLIRLNGCRSIREHVLTETEMIEASRKEEKPAKRPYKRRGLSGVSAESA